MGFCLLLCTFLCNCCRHRLQKSLSHFFTVNIKFDCEGGVYELKVQSLQKQEQFAPLPHDILSLTTRDGRTMSSQDSSAFGTVVGVK
eukprot:g16326.t1